MSLQTLVPLKLSNLCTEVLLMLFFYVFSECWSVAKCSVIGRRKYSQITYFTFSEFVIGITKIPSIIGNIINPKRISFLAVLVTVLL